MAKSSKESETEYVKKGVHENPVDPCKGWFDSCEYCDKRFCEWIIVDEEIYDKIPEKPGFFMIALRNKNTTEVVSILYNPTNIQKFAISSMDKIKQQISDKKNKTNKSVMLVRWMTSKKSEDKENSILCAHWYNNGVLPRFSTSWPGENLMEESSAIVFARQTQKWCYKQKDPVWRKAKPPPSKSTEEVKKCNFQSCDLCDSYFTDWKSLDTVIDEELAPADNGLVMLSVVYGKNREVVLIDNDHKKVVVPIRDRIKSYERDRRYFLKDSKYENQNARFEVRWTVIKDVDSDNSCYLYAHWYNADSWPKLNHQYLCLFGEVPLNKNKHFVLRTHDKKWMYEIETLKTPKNTKAKHRKQLLEDLNAENYEESELT